ncbi:gamma-glutamylcyclotransferase family protein, partial [Meiothermus taiwanensis]
MDVPEAVFVYGTLKQGERNFQVSKEAGWLRSAEAYIEGFQLFHIPKGKGRPYAYPGVVPGEG